MKSYAGVNIQMKPVKQYFHMVLFIKPVEEAPPNISQKASLYYFSPKKLVLLYLLEKV